MEYVHTFNSLTLHDRGKMVLNVSPFYWFECKSIDGLWGTDVEVDSFPIPGGTGEHIGTPVKRGRTITYTGRLWASNLETLRAGQRAIQQALDDKQVHNLAIQYKGTASTEVAFYFKAYCSQDVVMPEEQADDRMFRTFTFALRCPDPRSYKVSDNSLWPSWQA